jgi:hypothetical protein
MARRRLDNQPGIEAAYILIADKWLRQGEGTPAGQFPRHQSKGPESLTALSESQPARCRRGRLRLEPPPGQRQGAASAL